MSEVCFIEARPRAVATGAEQIIRLAGGGGDARYYRGGQHYRAGVVAMPRFRAAFGFDDNGWTGGTVPTSGPLAFAPGDTSLIGALLAHYWRDAPITVDAGEESGVLARRLTGSIASIAASDGQLSLTIADPSALLDKPMLGDGFTGEGGIEGPVEAAGRAKRRSWGLVFNVEGFLLDKAHNIHEFGDPAHGFAAFTAVRDMGRAGSMTVLAWQGSVAATFAALQAADVPQGGCVAAPSIACVKWWTVPAGPLTADIQGENVGGYVDTPVAIAARMLAAVDGPAIADQAAADALRPATCGIHIATGTDTVAQAIDRLFLGCSLYWVLQPAGTVRVGEWAWTAPVESFQAEFIGRERQLPPVKSRQVGYRRNHRTHDAGEISAAVLLADDVTYLDGTPVEHLKPAEPGATDGATLGAGETPGNVKDSAGNPLTEEDVVTSQGTALNTNNIGPFTTAEFTDKVADAEAQIADLFDTYGDTASAAASAAAASAAEANAQQARDDAQDASFAADQARIASQTAATNSDGSATASAGYAGAALASKTAAETASSAANSAKVAAESARDSSSGFASAASGSASTAATKATEAGASASAAAGHANDASTARGQAQTYAGQAATARDDAQGHSATASSQAALSANSANAAQKAAQRSLPSTFEDGALYFKGDGSASSPTRLAPGTDPTYGPYLETTLSTSWSITATKGRVPCGPNQKWKVRAQIAHVAGTPTTAHARIENYAAVSGGAPTTIPTLLFGTVSSTTPTWFESPVFTVSGPFICPAVVLNYLTSSAVQRIFALELIDVDAAEKAADSAAAAVISASTASTKATEAGASASASTAAKVAAESARDNASSSASAASGSAATASTQAGVATTQAGLAAGYKDTAQTQAGISTSQAAIATAQASAAAASAILSASIGNSSIIADPGFDDYPSGTVGQRPTKWFANAAAITNMQRVADAQGGYSVAFDGPASQDAYVYSNGAYTGAVETNSYYVVELDAELVSGALTGAAFGARSLTSAGADLQSLFYALATTADANGNVIGVGTTGKVYRWRKLIRFTTAAASGVRLFVFSHLTGYGSTAAANRIIVHKCGIRAATPAEIRDQTVLAPMEATVATQSTVLATHTTQLASRLERVSAGPASAKLKMTALNSSGGAASRIELEADAFSFGTSDGVVLEAVDDRVQVNGDLYVNNGKFIIDTGTHMEVAGQGFGTANQFIRWYGPKMAMNLCSEANAISYSKADGESYYGGALHAGVLTASATNPDLSATAALPLGPIGTNGNPIAVAVSWTYQTVETKNYTADIAGRNAFDADAATYGASDGGGNNWAGSTALTVGNSTVTLARKIGAGSFANVQSGSATSRNGAFVGQRPVVPSAPGTATITRSSTIVFTFTDSAGGTGDRTFTATLARGFTDSNGASTQRVSIVTTEQ